MQAFRPGEVVLHQREKNNMNTGVDRNKDEVKDETITHEYDPLKETARFTFMNHHSKIHFIINNV